MKVEIGQEFFLITRNGAIRGPYKVKEILKKVFKLDDKAASSFLIINHRAYGSTSYAASRAEPFSAEFSQQQEKQNINHALKQEIKFLAKELNQDFNWLTGGQKTALIKEMRSFVTKIIVPYGKPRHQLSKEIKDANEAALRNIFTPKKDTY